MPDCPGGCLCDACCENARRASDHLEVDRRLAGWEEIVQGHPEYGWKRAELHPGI